MQVSCLKRRFFLTLMHSKLTYHRKFRNFVSVIIAMLDATDRIYSHKAKDYDAQLL